MARRSSSSVIRRVVLERASRPLLARFLEPHRAFFASHSIDLGALAAASQNDRAIPRKIFAVLNSEATSPVPPEPLQASLAALDHLAYTEGATELFRVDREMRLARNTHTPEDLALIALLDHPEIASLARLSARPVTEQKFQEFAPSRKLGNVRFDEAVVEKLKAWLAEAFFAIDHTAYCAVEVYSKENHVEIEIDHGSPARARDTIDTKTLTIAQRTDHVARRVFARFDRKTGRLCIRALLAARELVRRGFGIVLADEPGLFRPGGLYSLAPFKDLPTALAPKDGLRHVQLRMLVVACNDNTKLSGSNPIDLLESDEGRRSTALHLELGNPVAVRVYLKHDAHAKPIKLELSANELHNAVEFDRKNATVVRIVEEYLRDRGVLCDPNVEEDAGALDPELAVERTEAQVRSDGTRVRDGVVFRETAT